MEKVSVILGTYNRLKFLKLTVDSIRKELMGSDCEIIIVDGGSTDGTISWLAKQKDVITIIQHNRGEWKGKLIQQKSWGFFMNLGFKSASGKYVCMISDDCIVLPGAIRNGYELFERELAIGKKIGAVAFYWRNWPEMKNYWVGLTLGNKMFVNHGMYLKQALEVVGYIDEKSFAFYHADGDLCLKMWQAGYEIIDSLESYVEHFSHANVIVRTTNSKHQESDWKTYLNKWENIFYHRDANDIGDWIYRRNLNVNCFAIVLRKIAFDANRTRITKWLVKLLWRLEIK
ncbi:MAG: glycosyltransferase [Negativicutes bacterium]|jgi:glycosyltransferase involved in cell wall biosynthesis